MPPISNACSRCSLPSTAARPTFAATTARSSSPRPLEVGLLPNSSRGFQDLLGATKGRPQPPLESDESRIYGIRRYLNVNSVSLLRLQVIECPEFAPGGNAPALLVVLVTLEARRQRVRARGLEDHISREGPTSHRHLRRGVTLIVGERRSAQKLISIRSAHLPQHQTPRDRIAAPVVARHRAAVVRCETEVPLA